MESDHQSEEQLALNPMIVDTDGGERESVTSQEDHIDGTNEQVPQEESANGHAASDQFTSGVEEDESEVLAHEPQAVSTPQSPARLPEDVLEQIRVVLEQPVITINTAVPKAIPIETPPHVNTEDESVLIKSPKASKTGLQGLLGSLQ